MKIHKCLIGLALCAGCALMMGCSKKEPAEQQAVQPPPTSSQSGADLQKAASDVKAAAEKAAADVKTAAEKTAADAKAAGDKAAAEAASMVQAKIDQVKGLVSDKKYQDAMNLLSQLANLQLTPDQQKLVSELKSQVQQLMASEAAKGAAGSLFKK